MESDEEYEYEETTVVAEIQGVMDAEFLADVKQAKILGIDGDKPLLQLDDYTFSGQYEDTMGTCMLFQDVTDKQDPDGTKKKLEYSCLSFKKLCLQSVFLKKNDDTVPDKSKQAELDSASKPSTSTDTKCESVPESFATETDKQSKPPDEAVCETVDENMDKEKQDSKNSGSGLSAGNANTTNDPVAETSMITIDPLDETLNTSTTKDEEVHVSNTGTANDRVDETSIITIDPLEETSNTTNEPMDGT